MDNETASKIIATIGTALKLIGLQSDRIDLASAISSAIDDRVTENTSDIEGLESSLDILESHLDDDARKLSSEVEVLHQRVNVLLDRNTHLEERVEDLEDYIKAVVAIEWRLKDIEAALTASSARADLLATPKRHRGDIGWTDIA